MAKRRNDEPTPVQQPSQLEGYPVTVQRIATHPRLTGLLLFGGGLFGCKLTMYGVIQSAQAQATKSISLSAKLIVVIVVITLIGLIYMVGGRTAVLFWARKKGGRTRPLQLVLAIALAGVGFGMYWWLEQQLKAMGYQFN